MNIGPLTGAAAGAEQHRIGIQALAGGLRGVIIGKAGIDRSAVVNPVYLALPVAGKINIPGSIGLFRRVHRLRASPWLGAGSRRHTSATGFQQYKKGQNKNEAPGCHRKGFEVLKDNIPPKEKQTLSGLINDKQNLNHPIMYIQLRYLL